MPKLITLPAIDYATEREGATEKRTEHVITIRCSHELAIALMDQATKLSTEIRAHTGKYAKISMQQLCIMRLASALDVDLANVPEFRSNLTSGIRKKRAQNKAKAKTKTEPVPVPEQSYPEPHPAYTPKYQPQQDTRVKPNPPDYVPPPGMHDVRPATAGYKGDPTPEEIAERAAELRSMSTDSTGTHE
jgi:hypothetical protein